MRYAQPNFTSRKDSFMDHKHLPYWLAALYLPGIGPRKLMRWLAHFDDIEQLFLASSEALQTIGVSAKSIHALQHPDWKAVEQDLAWERHPHHHLIAFDNVDYPNLLKEIADPPPVLYVRGNKTVLANVQLAMVGSRHATPSGLKNAEQFAYYLAEAGFSITSGLALGIDGASHRGALAANGVTIGVAGTGLNHTYPPAHRSLVEEIIHQDGAVISEFPLPTPPQAMNFPRRNRIIGGLTRGVIVVEAALKSGSLITARHALEQGREVFAIPGSIHHPLARGCHHLIRQGAKLVETAADILDELGAHKVPILKKEKRISAEEMAPHADLSLDCQQILNQIGYEITPLDVIILRSGLTAGGVSSILLTLELNGYVQSVPGGYARVIAN
jgi:DNA processing protein